MLSKKIAGIESRKDLSERPMGTTIVDCCVWIKWFCNKGKKSERDLSKRPTADAIVDYAYARLACCVRARAFAADAV
jgi:hypothetical protein